MAYLQWISVNLGGYFIYKSLAVTLSYCHTAILSHCNTDTLPYCHTVTLPQCHSVTLSQCHTITVSQCHTPPGHTAHRSAGPRNTRSGLCARLCHIYIFLDYMLDYVLVWNICQTIFLNYVLYWTVCDIPFPVREVSTFLGDHRFFWFDQSVGLVLGSYKCVTGLLQMCVLQGRYRDLTGELQRC